MTTKPKSDTRRLPDRAPLAEIKASFSRFVRDVQTRGQAVTITLHGRDAAILAPIPPAEARAPLAIRPPLEERALGELIQGALPGGRRVSIEAIERVIDELRGNRL